MSTGPITKINSLEILGVLEEETPKTLNEIYFELELQGFTVYNLGQTYLDHINKTLVDLERQGKVKGTQKGKKNSLAYILRNN
ncbi:hypothetical protein J4465_00865 [Candidatus Pacearchaeota archaeon]|nr:hypothetical protein [Candidatus Pacearchaeota archaeon]